MKIIIPHNILGKDVYDSIGKIHVTENITRAEAERLKLIFPSVKIIEDHPAKKKQEQKQKHRYKEEKKSEE